MSSKKKSMSGLVSSTPRQSKKSNKPRPKLVKIKDKETGTNTFRKVTEALDPSAVTNNKIVEGPECTFPFDNGTRGTGLKAASKRVTDVLNDHVVRCSIPIEHMASNCEKLQPKLANLTIDRGEESRPMLEASINEVFRETVEDSFGLNKSIFLQELHKLLLIASSQPDKLSSETLLSIVQDLSVSGASVFEYESGCPPKVSSTVWKFYDLTEFEFMRLTDQERLLLTMKYMKEGTEYYNKVTTFINEEHRKLVEKGVSDPLINWPEAKAREAEMGEALKRNNDMWRFFSMEHARLKLQNEMGRDPLKDAYRSYALNGEIGARSEEMEIELEAGFLATPMEVLKMMIHEDVGLKKRDPAKKSPCSYIPNPALYSVHDFP